MKIIYQSKPKPTHGDIRRLKKFAWLPTKIDDTWVFLEHYIKTQVYKKYYDMPDFEGNEVIFYEWTTLTLDFYGKRK